VLGAVPAFTEAAIHLWTTGEIISSLLSALHGFKSLVEAATIELDSDHARVVKILWLDQPNATRVRMNDLHAAMAISEAVLQTLVEDLSTLGIIEREGEWVIKRDRIVLSA
jgi:hypothetical protein